MSSSESHAFATATASAFGGGNNAQAHAAAFSQGIKQHGCGYYQQAFAQVSCFSTLLLLLAIVVVTRGVCVLRVIPLIGGSTEKHIMRSKKWLTVLKAEAPNQRRVTLT